MKASLLNKLDILQDRFEELTALLGDGEVISDQNKFRTYSKEYAEVEPIVETYKQLLKVQGDLEGAQALLKDSDPDMREMAVEEVREAKEKLIELEGGLQRMLLPKDPNDGRNVFLEIRAGTGGDEAAIMRSLSKLAKTLPPDTVCLTGHGDSTTMARELMQNPFMQM